MEKVTAGWQRGGAQNETRQAASLRESYVDCKRRAADSGAVRSWRPGVDERRSYRAGADLCRRLRAVQRGGAARHETGCAGQFSDWGDSLSVDRFDRAEDSHFRRNGGRARLRVGRGRGRWKEIQRALRLPRCATETHWGVEIGGVAVGAAGRRVTATFCANLFFRWTQPVLPVRPEEPRDPGQQKGADHGVEFVEVLAQRAPVLAELHAEVGQRETPRPRSQESVDMEFAARHARDSGGQRDKGADHRQKARDKHGHVSPALKETIGPVELTTAHRDPASVALAQRASAVAADFVGDERS